MNAQARVPPQGMLRVFEVAEEVGEMHDAGDVRFGELYASFHTERRTQDFYLLPSKF
jgi:hypothetical protein